MNDKIGKIYIVCAIIIPIILVIVAIAVKEGTPKKITKNTYVHIFCTPEIPKCTEVENDLKDLDLNFMTVYHDVKNEEELKLYDKVTTYFELGNELYFPLIVINNHFQNNYDSGEISKLIEEANDIYSKEKLTKDDITNYNIVDQLNLSK